MASNQYKKTNHYTGIEGERYFQYQNAIGFGGASIEARKFSPFINKEDVVMDFGCGGGHLLAMLNCKKKYGVELNPSAREEAIKYGFPVFEDCSHIEKKSIDKVISNHCLEHVLCPINALMEIRDCLKPGGKIILCIPIDDWRTEKHFSKRDINHHLYTWTPQLIGNCLLEAGYQVESIRIYTHAWPPMFHIWDGLFPTWFFDILCRVTAILFKRRQIIAIGTKSEIQTTT
jgi:SAM-dependent methyltransferase